MSGNICYTLIWYPHISWCIQWWHKGFQASGVSFINAVSQVHESSVVISDVTQVHVSKLSQRFMYQCGATGPGTNAGTQVHVPMWCHRSRNQCCATGPCMKAVPHVRVPMWCQRSRNQCCATGPCIKAVPYVHVSKLYHTSMYQCGATGPMVSHCFMYQQCAICPRRITVDTNLALYLIMYVSSVIHTQGQQRNLNNYIRSYMEY